MSEPEDFFVVSESSTNQIMSVIRYEGISMMILDQTWPNKVGVTFHNGVLHWVAFVNARLAQAMVDSFYHWLKKRSRNGASDRLDGSSIE